MVGKWRGMPLLISMPEESRTEGYRVEFSRIPVVDPVFARFLDSDS